ncbi:SMC-Scp complex subunit ScpB [Ureaplasma sp. ES3154-GEN]|uniref:SMC-Scp complex subunit ScpB n=1 Tax=Ureaplasma sp. ES3154-GEN TaxID=2984844 RepID=UPI0021E7D524|nr:SMC-Scp complex subunit ScpB [Ureaplasma sp. ES3154-GEN]MCV3743311.1 SMC-Scp complex subunit ScpB [Ureaplasma sp. ES3154-GEN]
MNKPNILHNLYPKKQDDTHDHLGFKDNDYFIESTSDEDEIFKQSLKKHKTKTRIENEYYQAKIVTEDDFDNKSSKTSDIFRPVDPNTIIKKTSEKKEIILNNSVQKQSNNAANFIKNKKQIKFNTLHQNFEKQKFTNTFKITDLNDEQIQNAISVIESILYLTGEDGASLNDFKNALQLEHYDITDILNKLQKNYETSNSGVVLVKFGDKYKILTKPKNKQHLVLFVNEPTRLILSKTTMITLAIIAYNQPTTRAKIYQIRKKDPKSAIDTLLKHNLIIEAGRAPTLGSPLLYKVSQRFFDLFGIKNIAELPKLEKDFHNFNPVDVGEENWE